jgi:hypothetical protein
VRQVDIAAPAVVRVATTVTGAISFDLCGKIAALPNQATLGGTGSGAFISAHGDVLTADHVVDIDRSELDAEWFASPTQAGAIAALLNHYAACLQLPRPLTADDILSGYVQAVGIPFSTQYSPPTHRVWLNTTYTGPISGTTSSSFLKSLLSADSLTATVEGTSPFAQNDVAILHVDATDTPYIQLDDSSDVAVQDHLTVVGFPGNADFFHPDGTYDASDLLTPSVNTLYVSAIKSGVTGDKLIQVGGNIEHGDSGGPVLDSAGHIVGVVSYSGTDTPVGTFFLRTSNDALLLARSSTLNTQPGRLQTLWAQAFADYAATMPGHWHTAARELGDLLAQYPTFHGAQPYKDYATGAAASETVPAQSDTTLIAAIAIGGALLILILLLVLIAVLRGSRRRPALAGAGGYPAYSPYGYPLPPGTSLASPLTPMRLPIAAELLEVAKRQPMAQLPWGADVTASGSQPTSGAAPAAALSAPSAQAPFPSASISPAPSAPQSGASYPMPAPLPSGQASAAFAPAPSQPPSAPGWPAGPTTPLRPTIPGVCLNGHRMPPPLHAQNAIRCLA